MSTRLLLGAILSIALVSTGWAQDDILPEVDKDGLHLVRNSKVQVAYILPGASLGAYTKVKLLNIYVKFKDEYERDFNMGTIGLNGRVTDMVMEESKTNLAEEFTKEFTKVLTEKGYPVVDETGPDILLLRPAILNLEIAAPPTNSSLSVGQARLTSPAGRMALYMEMYDSATSQLIARVADTRADNSAFFRRRASRATNKLAADEIIGVWAKMLAEYLDETKQFTKE